MNFSNNESLRLLGGKEDLCKLDCDKFSHVIAMNDYVNKSYKKRRHICLMRYRSKPAIFTELKSGYFGGI